MAHPTYRQLLRLSLGTGKGLSRRLKTTEWSMLYVQALRQKLPAFLYDGLMAMPEEYRPSPPLFDDWRMKADSTKLDYDLGLMKLYSIKRPGPDACLLKGAASAKYYPHPSSRCCDDPILWVKGNLLGLPEGTPKFLEHNFAQYAASYEEIIFKEKGDPELLYILPSLRFQTVYCIADLYCRAKSEGAYPRELTDLFYYLRQLDEQEKEWVYDDVCRLGLRSFCRHLMYVLESALGLEAEAALCPPAAGSGLGYRFVL